jgi:hypothetical protein
MIQRVLAQAFTCSPPSAHVGARGAGVQSPARRARRRHRLHPAAGAQLRAARREAEAAGLLAEQASIAIDPIIYDQLSRFGLRQKRLLEGVVARHAGVAPATFANIREYALLFWANRGNHNETTAQKFLPSFTFDELQDAALTAQRGRRVRVGLRGRAGADDRGRREERARRLEGVDLRPEVSSLRSR